MDTEQRAAEGRRIARARGDRRWSQEELARRARVAPNTVGRIENGGTAQPGKVAAVREALGLEPPADHESQDETAYPPDVQLICDAVGIWLCDMPDSQRARAVARIFKAVATP